MAVVDIAKRIRTFLIENLKHKKNNNCRDSKQSKLYDYLISPAYSRDMQARLEAKLKLDELQRKEEDYHRTTWSKRKEFIEKWFNVDHKHERIIDDITQEDRSPDADKKHQVKAMEKMIHHTLNFVGLKGIFALQWKKIILY